MNSLCQTCKKMLYRTDPCKGAGVVCGRTDNGSKSSGAAVAGAAAPRKGTGRKLSVSTPTAKRIELEDSASSVEQSVSVKPIAGPPKNGPATRSTAAKAGAVSNQHRSHGSSVVEQGGASCDGPSLLVAGSIPALSVDLTTRGTPRIRAHKGTFDRKAYQREKAKARRERDRAALKAKGETK